MTPRLTWTSSFQILCSRLRWQSLHVTSSFGSLNFAGSLHGTRQGSIRHHLFTLAHESFGSRAGRRRHLRAFQRGLISLRKRSRLDHPPPAFRGVDTALLACPPFRGGVARVSLHTSIRSGAHWSISSGPLPVRSPPTTWHHPAAFSRSPSCS